MKVLLANSPFSGGGITTYATQLIACLSEDTELSVVVAHDKKAPIKNERVKVYYYDTQALTVKNALFFIDFINNLVKPDVVIASAACIIPVIAPYIDEHIKIITVSHSGRYFHSEYSVINNAYVDHIIAASSDYNKAFLEKKYHIADKEKIKVIYNFLDRSEDLENLRLKKINQQPFTIIYANGGSVHKSPDLVAMIVTELLNTNLDFRFYWMGKPIIPLTTTLFKRSKLKSAKQLFPKDERLVFPGYFLDKNEFDKFLGSANVMLAPSNNEGCSMALLEGHRSGSIFIVADYENSNREIVSKGKSGFVIDRNDVKRFVEVIRDMITNRRKYDDYYERSHQTYVDYLTYPVWRKKIFEVIGLTANHKVRKKKAGKVGIYIGLLKMRWLKRCCLADGFFHQSLPSYLSFRSQYKDAIRRGVANLRNE